MRVRQLAFVLPLSVFIVVAIAFGFGLMRDPSIIPSPLIDKPVPKFSLPPLNAGEPGLSDADLRGQISVVNVFASWCLPCRIEHPSITRLAKEKRLPVYGINYKDRPEDARAWLAGLGNPYSRIGADRDGRASIDWGVYGLPETFIIDGAGRIRFKHVGAIQNDDLEVKILPVIRKLQAGKR